MVSLVCHFLSYLLISVCPLFNFHFYVYYLWGLFISSLSLLSSFRLPIQYVLFLSLSHSLSLIFIIYSLLFFSLLLHVFWVFGISLITFLFSFLFYRHYQVFIVYLGFFFIYSTKNKSTIYPNVT